MILSAFQFSSLPMLGWLAAALLPWLIHRFMRERHQTTSWAAVELLLLAVKQRSRRVYIQQWLLLAIRTIILVLVALAIAEPFWRTRGYGVGDASPHHQILLIDQSYSMNCRGEDNSRLEQAKKFAKQLVNQTPSGITSVIEWASNTLNPLGRPITQTSIATTTIDSLQQQHAVADLSKAVQAANAAIDRANQDWPQITQHHVTFISDQTQTTWSAEKIATAGFSELSKRASLSFVNIDNSQQENQAVVDIDINSAVVLQHQPLSISASIQNFGSQSSAEATLELKVDGQPVATKTITFLTNSKHTVTFPYQFSDDGRHTIQVSLVDHNDALALDDHRWQVVNVRPRLKIACIEGFPKAAIDIARALMPYRSAEASNNTIQLEVVPESSLVDLDLSQFDAVLLCSIQKLTPTEQTRLSDYVRAGGGLGIFVGQKTIIAGELETLLPVKINPTIHSGDYQFDPLDYAHSILDPFRGQATSGLLQVSIDRYHSLSIKPGRESVEIVLSFNSGEPAFVVEKIAAGRLAVLALPATLTKQLDNDLPWSTLPISPSFLPLIRELVDFLASDSRLQLQNVLVDQPALCTWELNRRSIPIEVRGPDNLEFILPAPGAEDDGKVIFNSTHNAGIYTLTTAGEEFSRIAVNIDSRESNLATVKTDSLPNQLKDNAINATQSQLVASNSHSLAPVLLIVALLLLFAESILACWQGRAWQ